MKKIIRKSAICLNLLGVRLQKISIQIKQTEPLQGDIKNQGRLIAESFSRIRYGKNGTLNWITRPYSANDGKVQKKLLYIINSKY